MPLTMRFWPEVMQGKRRGHGTVPFTRSSSSVLLSNYCLCLVIVSSVIHDLGKKKRIDIFNAIRSNWYKMCFELIIERNIGEKKKEITGTWPGCLY